MGIRDSRNVSAVKGANIWPHAKLLFGALIFCILFLAACNDEEESVTPPPAPPVAGPDLTITINSIADAGILGFPFLENQATVNFTVSNGGTLPTDGSAFWVDFFGNISPQPALGAVGDSAFLFAPGVIAAGGASPQVNTFTTLASGGAAYTIVDSQGDVIVESNEGNNVSTTFGWSLSRSDLTVVINSVIDLGDTTADFNFTITNNGLFPTDGTFFDVDFFFDPGFVPVLGVDLDQFNTIGPIIAGGGGTFTTTFNVFIFGTIAGTAYAMVNSTLFLLEMDVTNNVSPGFVWP